MTIKGVYVLVHWKSVLNDKIKVNLKWQGTPLGSAWVNLGSHSPWTLDTINFTDANDWDYLDINSGSQFKVSIQKITQGTSEPVLIDWVGTLVEYADVQATNCLISGETKGNDQDGSIQFHNYGTIDASDFEFKIKIDSSDYSDYDTWVNEAYSGTSLNAGSSTWRSFNIPKIFEGTENKEGTTWKGWFALNCGDYEITDVYTFGDDWGYAISHPSNSEFDIDSSSGKPAIFLHLMYDTEFLDCISNNNFKNYSHSIEGIKEFYEDDILERDCLINVDNESGEYTWTRTFEEQFVNIIPVYGTWNPNNTDYWWDDLDEAAENNLGISDWNHGGPGITYAANHGFDLLTGLTGIDGCTGQKHQNRNYVAWDGTWLDVYNLKWARPVVLHELIHEFGIDDAKESVWNGTGEPYINKGNPELDQGYIMSGIELGLNQTAQPQIDYWQEDDLWPVHMITLQYFRDDFFGGL